MRPTSLFERSLLPTLHHHLPNRLIGTRIAPLVAHVSSLHEALVAPYTSRCVAASKPQPHVGFSAACASHLGLFLTAAHLASRPALMMIICAQRLLGLLLSEIRTRWWERGGIQALIFRRCCARGGHLLLLRQSHRSPSSTVRVALRMAPTVSSPEGIARYAYDVTYEQT